MRKLNVLIAGSTGYIGVQLIKLLIKHKYINIKYLCGKNSVGKKISTFDKSLKFKGLPKIVKFKRSFLSDVDVIFTALPNGEAQDISKYLYKQNVLIDLSADFRLKKSSDYLKWYKQKHRAVENIKKSIYSLPEITKEKIKNYSIISCPGCYPTSILLPLIPLLKNKQIKSSNIIVDSKSGYSGAGRGIHKKYQNQNLYESLSAYGVGNHRHNSEIYQELSKYTKSNLSFDFTPHLSPMFKGILSTIYVDLHSNITQQKVINNLVKYYKKDKFIKILKKDKLLSTNDVIDNNYCYISVCKTKIKSRLIILSTIDNLIKGGAGQGIQNLNVRFNFPISTGLI